MGGYGRNYNPNNNTLRKMGWSKAKAEFEAQEERKRYDREEREKRDREASPGQQTTSWWDIRQHVQNYSAKLRSAENARKNAENSRKRRARRNRAERRRLARTYRPTERIGANCLQVEVHFT